MEFEIFGSYTLEQPPLVARLGTDSLWLSRFVTLKPHEKFCDLGCGNGAVSFLALSRVASLHITAVDRSPEATDATQANAQRNHVSMDVRLGDWRDKNLLPAGYFDIVVSNPPYFAPHTGAISRDTARAGARTADPNGLADLVAAMARITRTGGKAALVYPATHLSAVLTCLTQVGLEPKRLQMLHHRHNKTASLALVETRRCGQVGLTVLPPIIVSEVTT